MRRKKFFMADLGGTACFTVRFVMAKWLIWRSLAKTAQPGAEGLAKASPSAPGLEASAGNRLVRHFAAGITAKKRTPRRPCPLHPGVAAGARHMRWGSSVLRIFFSAATSSWRMR